MKCTVGGVLSRLLLTHHEAHQFVGQEAGADESHPQGDVELLSDLRLHPHEQAETHTHTHKKESGHTVKRRNDRVTNQASGSAKIYTN